MKPMNPRSTAVLLAIVVSITAAQQASAQSSQASKSELSGLASVSGTVTSGPPFTAAKVYFRNVEKQMQYMVYTSGGKYQALYLLPGKYEIRVEARGLESDLTEVMLKPGENPPQNAT